MYSSYDFKHTDRAWTLRVQVAPKLAGWNATMGACGSCCSAPTGDGGNHAKMGEGLGSKANPVVFRWGYCYGYHGYRF